MTGMVKSLSAEGGSGVIEADEGVGFYSFDLSEVLEYDVTCLTVGQLVTFALGRGSRPRAVGVAVLKPDFISDSQRKRQEALSFRYMGFDHRGSIRAYRFQLVCPGEEFRTIIVTIDVELFAKHRVGIQEGPGLCLRRLMAEPDAVGAAGDVKRRLTDEDLLAHLASREASRARAHSRRSPRSSNACSRPIETTR